MDMLATAARIFLALYFGLSASGKVRNIDRFAGNVAAYRLLPASIIFPTAFLLVLAELLVAGTLLVLGGVVPAAAAGGLITIFTIAIAVNLLRGHVDIDCGCHLGDRPEPLGWHLVLRNLLLILAALVASSEGGAPALLKLSGAATGVAAFLLLLAAHALRSLRPAPPRT